MQLLCSLATMLKEEELHWKVHCCTAFSTAALSAKPDTDPFVYEHHILIHHVHEFLSFLISNYNHN